MLNTKHCRTDNETAKTLKTSKAQVQKNDRFAMGDEEIADEGVPRSGYELQALAIHAKDHAC